MYDWYIYLAGLAAMLGLGVLSWLLSLRLRDVSIVDSIWSLFFMLGAGVYAVISGSGGSMSVVLLTLVSIWAIRLSAYLSWRNWGEPEDRRYRAMRERNDPGFAMKSVYIIFALQALLAWVISLPLFVVLNVDTPATNITWAGALVVVFGILFESIADAQLANFTADPDNRGHVLDEGLWRYSRHPNYFGEFCVWWGFWLIALGAGAWWSILSPILMTILLMRISGVTLLEADISERRPGYRQYVASTSAFFPLPPRPKQTVNSQG